MTRLIFCIVLASLGQAAIAQTEGSQRPPNVLIFVADDMGFSDVGSYGGEIRTPNIDRLAAGGLRFTQFYNTARCWPTRTCILTGYYAQQVRMDPPRGRLPAFARLLPHHLKPLGYRSYQSGKWHVMGAPKAVADGGFDRSYIVHDHDRFFYPQKLEENDKPLPPVEPGTGYYSTTGIADHAIDCLKEHAEKHSDRPFFQYVAFQAPHFPLHAPADDIARYRDHYALGWDALREQRWRRLSELGIVDCKLRPLDSDLTPRYFKEQFMTQLGPGEVDRAVPWGGLTREQQTFQATKMAIHAAMVDRMDQEIGRILDQLRAMDVYEDTVIFFLSDNGADATLLIRGDGHDVSADPGSGGSYLCLGPGFASASNSPFHRHKIWVHEGGISTPLIVHWPKGIADRGQLRRAPGHVIDLVPTILELTGASPATLPPGIHAPEMPGRSLVPALAADVPIDREFLFFSHEGNRALRMGDWKLVSAREDNDEWALYDLKYDRGETTNLASDHPDRVRRMAQRWTELAEQYEKDAGPP